MGMSAVSGVTLHSPRAADQPLLLSFPEGGPSTVAALDGLPCFGELYREEPSWEATASS